jgi:hypothetical protein
MQGLREINLNDPEQGLIKILTPIPKDDDSWGVLAPLRDTSWGSRIITVSGEALSNAMHGWATPLMREIGPQPKAHAKRIPEADGVCSQIANCIGAGPQCRPGPKLPDCYEAPNLPIGVRMLAAFVALAWRDGRYVVVVKGSEFSIR